MNNGMPDVLGLEVKKAVEILKKGWLARLKPLEKEQFVSQKIKRN